MTSSFPAAPSASWRWTRQGVRLVLLLLVVVYILVTCLVLIFQSSSHQDERGSRDQDDISSIVVQAVLHDQHHHDRHDDDSISHFMLKSNDDNDDSNTTRIKTTPATEEAAWMMEDRNLMTHPITADESNRLIQALKTRHEQHVTASPLLRVAICHPTIFLDDDNTNSNSMFLSRFLSFVSYHRLLGFEHFFFWYEKNIATLPLFDTLAALPYVTMTEYRAPPGHDVPGKGYHGQRIVEELCLSDARFANSYDWALPMDADEFLWFAPINTTATDSSLPRYPTLQEFLEPYQAQNYTYLSIGKFSYTTLHVDNRYYNNNDDNGTSNIKNKNNKHNNYFGLLQYPYSTGPYCLNGNGKPICARRRGRAKVLVNPKIHTRINIHGMRGHKEPGGTHLHSIDVAHFMEWKHLHARPPNASTRVLHDDTKSFYVTTEEQVQTYRTIKASRKNKTGHVLVYHDGDNMAKWFDFLVQQLPPPPPPPP